jgi:hypothetical protein
MVTRLSLDEDIDDSKEALTRRLAAVEKDLSDWQGRIIRMGGQDSVGHHKRHGDLDHLIGPGTTTTAAGLLHYDHVVDPNYTGTDGDPVALAGGATSKLYSTIQAAIDQMMLDIVADSNGQTMYIIGKDDPYNETLVIPNVTLSSNEGILIQGEHQDRVVIQGIGGAALTIGEATNRIMLRDIGLLTNGPPSLTTSSSSIEVWCENVRFYDSVAGGFVGSNFTNCDFLDGYDIDVADFPQSNFFINCRFSNFSTWENNIVKHYFINCYWPATNDRIIATGNIDHVSFIGGGCTNLGKKFLHFNDPNGTIRGLSFTDFDFAPSPNADGVIHIEDTGGGQSEAEIRITGCHLENTTANPLIHAEGTGDVVRLALIANDFGLSTGPIVTGEYNDSVFGPNVPADFDINVTAGSGNLYIGTNVALTGDTGTVHGGDLQAAYDAGQDVTIGPVDPTDAISLTVDGVAIQALRVLLSGDSRESVALIPGGFLFGGGAGNPDVSLTWTSAGLIGIAVGDKFGADEIVEVSSAAGVTLDGVLLKDAKVLGGIYAADTGSADNYAIAPPQTITGYLAGQVFIFRAANANTGASTLDVDGQGTRAIVKHGTAALVANDIKAGQIVVVIYDSTTSNLEMVSQLGNSPAGGHDALTVGDAGHILTAQDLTSAPATESLSAHVELASTAELTAATADRVAALSNLAAQIQSNSWKYVADTGAADAYAITIVPTPPTYAAGQTFTFRAANANTGASTLAVNGQATRAIVKHGTAALAANDIKAGQIVTVSYDSATGNFEMTSQLGNAPAGGHAAVTVSGTPDYFTLSGQDLVRGLIDLAADVTGLLPEANIDALIARDAELHDAATMSGTPNYITLVGQDIVRGLIDLAADVTGLLPEANIDSLIARDSELHDAVTVSGVPNYITLVGQDIVRGLIDLAADVTGILPEANIDSLIARDSELHSAITMSGTPNYVTLVGQDIVRGLIDLAADVTGILPEANIDSLIARDSELHDAVTVSGTPNYITLSGQDIVRGLIDLATDVTGILPEANIDSLIARDSELHSAEVTATESAEGIVELAIAAELTTGTADRVAALANLAAQIQSNSWKYVADIGAADAYAITIVPTPPTYAAGQVFMFRATNANTGASTLAVNGQATRAIVKHGTAALAADDIKAGQTVIVIYDATSTNFEMVSQLGNAPSGGGGGGYDTIEDEGVALTQRTTVDFVGTYMKAVDDAGNTQTKVRAGYAHFDAIVDSDQYDADFDTASNDPPVFETLALAIADGAKSILYRKATGETAITIAGGDAVNFILGDDLHDAEIAVAVTINKIGLVMQNVAFTGVTSKIDLNAIGVTFIGCQFKGGSWAELGGTSSGLIACAFTSAGGVAQAAVDVLGIDNRVQACNFRLQASASLVSLGSAARRFSMTGCVNTASAETGYLIDASAGASIDGTINGNILEIPATASGAIIWTAFGNIAGNYIFYDPNVSSGTVGPLVQLSARNIFTGNIVNLSGSISGDTTEAILMDLLGLGNVLQGNSFQVQVLQALSSSPSIRAIDISEATGTQAGNIISGNTFQFISVLVGAGRTPTVYGVNPIDEDAAQVTMQGNYFMGTAYTPPWPWIPISRLARGASLGDHIGWPSPTKIFRLDMEEEFDQAVNPRNWVSITKSPTFPTLHGGGAVFAANGNADSGIRHPRNHVGLFVGGSESLGPAIGAWIDLASITSVRVWAGMAPVASWASAMARPTNGMFFELNTTVDGNWHLIVNNAGTPADDITLGAAVVGRNTLWGYLHKAAGAAVRLAGHLNTNVGVQGWGSITPPTTVCTVGALIQATTASGRDMNLHKLTWSVDHDI